MLDHDSCVKTVIDLLGPREITTELYTDSKKNRIDVALPLRSIAIEVQVSNMTKKEAMKRTNQLNKDGWYVLWLLEPNIHYIVKNNIQRQAKAIERFLHGIYYGRVYYISSIDKQIIPVHFETVETQYYEVEDPHGETYQTTDPYAFGGVSEGSPGWDFQESYTYYHKRNKLLNVGSPITTIRFIKKTSTDLPSNEKYKVAGLNDKRFW